MDGVWRDWGLPGLQRNQQWRPVYEMRRNGPVPQLHGHGPRREETGGIKVCTLKKQTNCKNRGEFRWLKFNSMMAKAWRARSSALSEKSCKRTSLRTSSATLSI